MVSALVLALVLELELGMVLGRAWAKVLGGEWELALELVLAKV